MKDQEHKRMGQGKKHLHYENVICHTLNGERGGKGEARATASIYEFSASYMNKSLRNL